MAVTDSWIAGREAVLAVERFCLDQRWVYFEVPGHADFGKDGYVDIVTEKGAVTGSCFAVQIKGGRSRRRSGGYRIEGSSNNRRQWANSTIPVIGLVWDPDMSRLFWLDLTDTLTTAGLNAELFVPASNHLTGGSEFRRFKKYVGSVAHRQASILDLVSPDADLQLAGIAAAYHIGRTDGRALVLLRKLFLGFHPEPRRSAVWALASAVPHPDILGSLDGSPDPAAEAVLERSIAWTVEEVCQLLDLIGEEGGVTRGSFGQHIHQLLIVDPAHKETMGRTAKKAALTGPPDVASWAFLLAVGWAGSNGVNEFERLLAEEPALGATWAAGQIARALEEVGYVSLF